MESNPTPTPAANNDNLMSLLSYVIAPIGGIIVLLSDAMKSNPVLRRHAVQGTAYSVAAFIISTILSATVILLCVAWLPIIPAIIWGIQAYQGKEVTIPVITDFCRKQGWFV
jgi:uncharacterized membrane protein